MAQARVIRHYFVTKTAAQTALGISGTVIDWRWEGLGFNGNLLVRKDDTDTPNTPIAGVTRRNENWIVIPWQEVYNQFFASIPAATFDRMTLSFTPTQIFFDLHLEE